MRRWLGALWVTCCVGVLTTEAQIVHVGPFGGVRVRAPFASVDVLPYGGARVRAPFTAVDSGVYRYGVPVYAGRVAVPVHPFVAPVHPLLGPVPPFVAPVHPLVEPVVPVPVLPAFPAYAYPEVVYPEPEVAAPVPREAERPIVGILDDRLRAAAVRLDHSLSLRRSDGDVWQDYLAPMSIVEVIDKGGDPKSLSKLISNYNGVVANTSLRSIRNAAGFRETRELLQQFIDRPYATPPQPVAPPQDAPVPAPDPAPMQAPVLPPQGELNEIRSNAEPNPFTQDTIPASSGAPAAEELPPPAADAARIPAPAAPVAEEARARKPVPI
ncbi:MAG: hypothetical protein AAGG48_20440 [Planctomycetota bacterium]